MTKPKQKPFIMINCGVRQASVFLHMELAGMLFFCLVSASQNHYRGLLPGQFYVSKKAWANELGVARSTLDRWLTQLQSDGMISVVTSKQGTIITVNEWARWHAGQLPGCIKIRQPYASKSGIGYAPNATQVSHETLHGLPHLVATTKKNKEEHIFLSSGGKNKTLPADDDDAFEDLWQAYPSRRRGRKQGAIRAYAQAVGQGADPDSMMAALHIDRQSDQWTQQNGQFIPSLTKWLQSEPWKTDTSENDHERGENTCRTL